MPLAMPQSWAFASRGLADSGARPDSSGKGMTPPPFDCTAQPSVASMATRPCLSSDARNHFMVVGRRELAEARGVPHDAAHLRADADLRRAERGPRRPRRGRLQRRRAREAQGQTPGHLDLRAASSPVFQFSRAPGRCCKSC